MHILFLSSEAVPFAKTGGLGDVAGMLPKVLAQSEKVMLMMPGYSTEVIKNLKTDHVDDFSLPIGGDSYSVSIKKIAISADFSVFFVLNEHFFDREFLYGDAHGDYPDNFRRFLLFQKAVLEFVLKNKFHFDIIHCNDWQTAMVPLLMKLDSRSVIFNKTKSIFSIHNLGYQGLFNAAFFRETGLPDYFFSPEYLEFYGKLNCLKAGIVFSDKLLTVSPTYAKEIVLREKGFGLDGLLRKFSYKLDGILNGVDYTLWDPAVDPFLKYHYSQQSLGRKEENKKVLFSELGIHCNSRLPLIIMISRISEQKGMDLLIKMLPFLFKEEIHFIFLGMGDLLWTNEIKNMATRFPGKMTFLNRFDEKMAHWLEAAADILIMPSVYEPCGLNQIYSMKYGTVPIVRATGGLEDSVQEFDPLSRNGTGFKFVGDGVGEVMAVMKKVLRFFSDNELWQKIQKNGMNMDFSWNRIAPKYLELYKKIAVEDSQNG